MASELTPVPDDLDFGVTVRGLVISQQVFGRYTLRHVLGRGGMGVVWLANDERLEREVALKFLPEIVNFDAAALDDLKRETRRCLDLTHPNIIRIYDFVKDQQAAAISMEYIDGKTLSALRIEKEKRVFEVDEISDWVSQACQALHYAHGEKVVHRDLKPANLMLTTRGQIKIADFGIARSVSDSVSQVTMRPGTSGTLVYMSPQQMNGDMSRITDDIYALGSTIYELLTSKPPFYSGDIPFQVRSAEPRSMGERRHDFDIEGNGIPPEWEEGIAACLAKAPGDRPQDALELAQRLGLHTTVAPRQAADTAKRSAVLPDVKTAAKKTPPLPRPPGKPFPTQLVLQGAGALAGLIVLGWLLWSFVLWPFIATPGKLVLTSNPQGATVHVSGQQDQTTPAEFDKLRIGHYKVTVSNDGYDPVEQPITITEGATKDLGLIQLQRAFGKLNLVTVPARARYTLAGTSMTTKDISREGITPEFFPNLPAGTYEITLSSEGLPPHTETVEVPPHDTRVENEDLIQLGLGATASPDVNKALQNQAPPDQLDAKAKSDYIDLLNAAFEKYMSAGLAGPAADEIAKLKSLGQNTQAREKELADKRAETEKTAGSQLGELIRDKKFATAQTQLKDLDGQVDPDALNRLKTQYQPPIDQYEQQVDAAITLSQSGTPDAAYAQLKTFADQYPDDIKLQLALAQLETRMPPEHNRLAAQLKVFHQFSTANKDAAENPDFQAMEDKFASELKQLDDLAAALARARSGSSGLNDKLLSLENERAATERRSVGPTEVAKNILNGFTRSFTGHDVVYTEDQRNADLRSYDNQIATVKQEIGDQDSSSSGNGLTQAQQAYDAFVARVPW